MAEFAPGLAPRKLEDQTTVVNNVVSDRMSQLSTEHNQPDTTLTEEVQAEDNTQATEQPKEEVVPAPEPQVPEQQLSEKASRRFQELANARRDAEARAAQAEEMLRRMVGEKVTPPAPSQDELLAKQYKSFDPNAGYPTDPREYAHYVGVQAQIAARETAQKINEETRNQRELDELTEAHPDVLNDPTLQGAIAAERSQARSKGVPLSYKQAADIVKNKLSGYSVAKKAEVTAKDIQAQNDAYVETTKGAAPNRSAQVVDPSKMSISEMEAWMKANGQW